MFILISGTVSIANECCLACGTKFKSKTDFSMADLRPTDQAKTDEALKRAKEECENLKSYCNVLKAKYKSEIEKLQKSTLGLKKEIEENMSEMEKQREQICQYSRLSKKLQLDLAACRRQITTLKPHNGLGDAATSKHYSAVSRCEFNFKPTEGMAQGRHKLFGSSPRIIFSSSSNSVNG
ncbi:hypothetical protein AMK59_4217 [Oryctes borbonicus]|uniref:Uncharacterized protein n=1 Tax=Oryctes borbonicus TaxID=1629725 RepID=A0A0T6B6L9_9SCAR|nr:hypothetical protein AMK59_4217 [Oryctes borbonicus]